MSAKNIKAGRAWVELSIMDKLDVGLKLARAKLDSFARGMAMAGTAIVASATAVLGVLGAAAKTFADVGSKLFDMQAATGLSAEELSGLSYAAGQSGASLEDVGAAMKALGKFTLDVKRGGKGAIQTLDELGISADAFLAATPLARFLMITEALSKIEDAGLRAGLAQKALGRGAMSLAEMMKDGAAGVQAMIKQAQEFGLIITSEEAAKADALGDSWDLLGSVWRQIAFVTGAALAETLTEIFKSVAKGGALLIEFIRNNQTLVKIVGGAAVAFLVLGSAMLAAAAAASLLSIVLAAVTVLLTPMGALVALVAVGLAINLAIIVALASALIAGVVAFFRFTDAGRAAASNIAVAFQMMWSVVSGILADIFRAMTSGHWELAGAIMAAAIMTGSIEALARLKKEMGPVGDFLFGSGDVLGAIAAAHRTNLAQLRALAAAAAGQIPALTPPGAGSPLAGLLGGGGTSASAFNAATAAAINRTVDPKSSDAKRAADAAEDADEKLGQILNEIRTRDLKWA